jgi:hypothetical protein
MPGCTTLGVQDVLPGRQRHAEIPILVRGHSCDFLAIRDFENDERKARIVNRCVFRPSRPGDLNRCRRNNPQVPFEDPRGNAIGCPNPRNGDQKQAADGGEVPLEQTITSSLIRIRQLQRPGAATVGGGVELAPPD